MNPSKVLRTYFLLPAFILLSCSLFSQSPGGVATGTARGWKAEYFDGNYGTNFNAFGHGSSKTTPDLWGYTGYISGEEFIGRDADYFGLQYSGTLEVPQTGNYSFNLYSIDDHVELYIDNVRRAVYTWSGSPGNITATVNLTAGDHSIRVKYIEAGGVNTAFIRWSGPGITANSDLDGRFVRVDNATLAAWYDASVANITPNYSTGRARLNSYINKAPAFSGHGNISNLGVGWSPLDINKNNFNPSGSFDGDDWFSNAANQNGLSLRSAPRTAFLINSFSSNATGASWLWGQNGNVNNTNAIGMYKSSGTQTSMARQNDGNPIVVSTYNTNEPKLLTGEILLGTGNAASVNNSRSMSANGGTASALGFTERITNYAGPYGIQLGAFLSSYASSAYIPEFIYYPFELNTQQKQRVNTYLAIKYGITLQHNYLSTSGNVLWNVTTNATYNNRVFGIGRELAAEGLNQKQSQSQMTGAAGYNFLTLSKGAIAETNAANTGVLNEGDYMIMGDNGAALATQSTGMPASFTASAGCTAARLSRAWKVQTAGNPGPVTLKAGASGVYLFPGTAAGLSVLVDTDGDGEFTTGTVTTYPVTVNNGGVATFNNVIIPNGSVVTFAWVIIAPGGVFGNLALWLKADGELYSDVAGTIPVVDGGTVALWRDGSASGNSVSQATAGNRPTYRNNATHFVNYNPVLQFTGGASYLQTSAISSALNNNITGFSAHKFTGTTADWNAIMGSRKGTTPNNRGWNVYITQASGLYSLWTATGDGWTQTTGTAADGQPDLVSFSAITGTGSKNIYRRGQLTATGTGDYLVNTTHQFQVGSNGDNNLNFGGNIYEQIVYSNVLSANDMLKVNSYLAIKYATPLDQTTAQNYVASNGAVIWNATANAVYKNNIFGIGRDDCSGLMQKQSKSTTAGDNVIVSIGNIAVSNRENTGSFSANRQYIVIGNDGGALSTITTDIPASFAAISCNAGRYAREWKVQNTGSTGAVTLAVGDAANKIKTSMTNLRLMVDVDGDGDFTTGTPVLYTAANLKSGIATFNNVDLPDGAVFTLCWTAAAPGGVMAPTSGTTSIAGVPHLNGLTYKLYTGTSTNYPVSLNLSALAVMPGTLVSTGYLDNLTNVQNLFTQYSNTYMGVEITGKIYIPAGATALRFRSNIVDDYVSVKIDGNNVLNVTTYAPTNTDGTIQNLAEGYYDIQVRFGQVATNITWNITWNNGSGAVYSAIPNANLFTAFNGPSAWYTADDIQLQNNPDGTNLGALSGSKWADMSINANDLTTTNASGNPLYYSNNAAYLRNYNPSVYLSEDYLSTGGAVNGFAFGETAKSVFSVSQDAGNSATRFYSTLGYSAVSNGTHQFGTVKRSTNRLAVFTYSNDYTETTPFYSTTAISTNIIGGTIGANRAATVYANGLSRGSAMLAAYSTWMAANRTLSVGGSFGETTAYTGNMNEIIHYPWALSATEQQKVNSYLAVKWGIALDQTTPTNYLSADGTITWAGDATYKYDITGIGRDDCSALNQLQSTATERTDILTIGKGMIAATNYANDSSFNGDKQFVIVAHNNGTINDLNSSSLPTALLSITDCYQKLGRVWKAQTTGSVGAVQLRLGKQGLFVFNKSYYKPKLLISSSSTDFTGATIVDADSISNGVVHFSNVNFSGTQYFTVAIIQAAPGGVASNLNLWLAADDGTSTQTDNTALTSWSDLSLQNMHGTGVNGPLYRAGSGVGAANFNPSVSFNGTNQSFTQPTGFSDFTAGTTAFGVLNTNFGTVANFSRLFHLSTSANNNVLAFLRDLNTNNIGLFTSNASASTTGSLYTPNNPLVTTNGFNVFGFRIQAGTTGQTGRTGNVYVNGATAASSSSVATPFTISRGANFVGRGGVSEYLNGYMPELILYNRDLTTTERNKIHSYLAVKYGRTIDASIGNYLASNGSVTYNYSTHWNRITAIGRDDCQALEQKQSKSAEAEGLVTIGVGNTIATSNAGNPETFINDKSYAIFGDNGKAVTWTGVDNLGNGLVRLNRIWRMKETGSIGTVYLEVPASASALATKLPASNTATDPVYLVISGSGNFKNAVTMVEMIPDVIGAATKWSITHDFADGDYFTFATKKLCLGPAGITDGLTTWYRADNKGTGVIVPTTGIIVDDKGTHTLVRDATGTATVIAGSGTSFNYNKAIRFASNAGLSKTGLTVNDVLAPDAGSLFAVTTSAAGGVFGMGINGNNTVVTGLGSGAQFNNVNSAFNGTPVSGKPNIFGMRAQVGTGVQSYLNGNAGSVATLASARPSGAWMLQLNTVFYDGWNNGDFGEAFSFNRRITDAEAQVLNSYLAIKYGQTINHNYYTPDYDGTNEAATTIYDISSYNNRIFGVGIDSTGCLYQKQSTSQLSGTLLKMSITNTMAAENTGNAGVFALDRTYVAAGDDDGAINAWTTGTTPAIYNNGNCDLPARIARQWKMKATNTQQTLLITIPDNISSASTKLPALPVGSTKLFMVANGNPDMSIADGQEELEMTFNAVTSEWEVLYTCPSGTYQYFTFVTKPDQAGLQPVVVGTGVQDAISTQCVGVPYIYYRGTSNSSNAIIAVNPNGNAWSPSSITINNQGTLTGGGATFSNTGSGYYQSTDGVQTMRIAKRLVTIVAPGSYPLSDGVLVRMYYNAADTMSMIADAMPAGKVIEREGWFKFEGDAAATIAAMTPTNIAAEELAPVARGIEQGVRYVEFLVNSFSTFGYFAKTTNLVLPVELEYFKGHVANCENVLSWKSGVELNFNYYELQYSSDGANFTSAGIQRAKGEGVAYELKHTPVTASIYYRLKMVDKDGTSKYSSIIKLVNNCEATRISLYPNPVRNELTISGIRPGAEIKISNASGGTIITAKANAAQKKIQIPNLAQGIYFVEIIDKQNGEKKIFKILKD